MDSYSDSSSSADAEDTAFYEELTRQILMLTDEDDDMGPPDGAVELPRGSAVGVGSRPVRRNVNYYSWLETGRSTTNSVPSWMEGLWATNSSVIGTGVFIPSGSGVAAPTGGKKSGRRRYNNNNNNKGRKNNDRGRMYYGAGQMIHG